MSDLKLDSLRIQNFRTFKDLTIDRLGRVNLIVGKNNVGKTALLEAIWLWNHPEYWYDISQMLKNKFPIEEGRNKRVAVNKRYQVIRSEFNNFPSLDEVIDMEIYIGPKSKNLNATKVRIKLEQEDDLIDTTPSSVPPPFLELVSGPWGKKGEFWRQENTKISISEPDNSRVKYKESENVINLVSSSGIKSREAEEFWENAIRSNEKDIAIDILNILLPDLEDLNWVNDPSISTWISGSTLRVRKSVAERVPMVTFPDEEKAIPLSAMGEGASRALWIGSSVVNSKNGILLVDEIENGLHYSIQPDLWRLIFETARDLDVQVFATTHSYDCVQAFEQVAQDYGRSESMLVSLRRREKDPEDIVAVLSDRDELGTVVEENIEVR